METHQTERPIVPSSTSHDSIAAAEMFWAGALAGLIAETVMHPFDTVSHRAKVRTKKKFRMHSADGVVPGTKNLFCTVKLSIVLVLIGSFGYL